MSCPHSLHSFMSCPHGFYHPQTHDHHLVLSNYSLTDRLSVRPLSHKARHVLYHLPLPPLFSLNVRAHVPTYRVVGCSGCTQLLDVLNPHHRPSHKARHELYHLPLPPPPPLFFSQRACAYSVGWLLRLYSARTTDTFVGWLPRTALTVWQSERGAHHHVHKVSFTSHPPSSFLSM